MVYVQLKFFQESICIKAKFVILKFFVNDSDKLTHGLSDLTVSLFYFSSSVLVFLKFHILLVVIDHMGYHTIYLNHYQHEGDKSLERIVIADKTRVSHFTSKKTTQVNSV